MFLAAQALGDPRAAALAKEVAAHPRFGEISEFWWYATAPTGQPVAAHAAARRHRPRAGPQNLFRYADELLAFEKVGYPGVTKDTRSKRWNTGDRDEVDDNWRWLADCLAAQQRRIRGVNLNFNRGLTAGTFSVRVNRRGFYPLDESGFTVQSGYDALYWPTQIERCPRGDCDPLRRPKKPPVCCE